MDNSSEAFHNFWEYRDLVRAAYLQTLYIVNAFAIGFKQVYFSSTCGASMVFKEM